MKSIFLVFTISLLSIQTVRAKVMADSSIQQDQVVAINWKRFGKSFKADKYIQQSRQMLSNAARYNLNWIVRTLKVNTNRGVYVIDNYNENGIRPSASVCYGIAVALKCANLNNEELRVSREEAYRRILMLIKGVVEGYKANQSDGNGWGKGWQTALWASLVGQGAWMLWDDLDPETRKMVQTMVIEEADRFIASDYKVPFWTSPEGIVNTPGDTKAEENAWNATILQLAVAMMPNHPHVIKWKLVCSELMISAFSLKRDLQNNRIVDGKPVKDWLHGFNVSDDGAVINHNIVHPDYTVTVTLNTRTFLTQSLAIQPVSQGAQMNAPFIYQSLTKHVWSSPPYKIPGGPMYIPGKAEVYYPQGTDWSKYRFDIYYLMDVNAFILGWDKGIKNKARDWMEIRANRILAMQARHSDGHMFTHEEYPTYPGCEQMVAWQIGDAYLLLWLHAHHSLAGSKQSVHQWLSNYVE
jgi:hypothetical protein